MKGYLREIGRRFQTIRLDNGFEIDELADYLDIDPSYIDDLENGDANLNTKFLKEVADVMSCDVDYLLNGY